MRICEYTSVDINELLPLYEIVGWTNYTENPLMLESAYRNSLKILAAWDNEKLVGIIRAVGDGYSILYIQDILVFPEYQGQGIGKRLLAEMDKLYPKVYQKVLLTDDKPETAGFYENCGFKRVTVYGCAAFAKYQLS